MRTVARVVALSFTLIACSAPLIVAERPAEDDPSFDFDPIGSRDAAPSFDSADFSDGEVLGPHEVLDGEAGTDTQTDAQSDA